MAHIGFDSTGIDPAKPMDLLPAGNYTVCIVKSDVKTTQAGDGKYIALEMTVLDGPYKNRKVWDNINYQNPNELTTKIGQATLSALCHAIGKPKLNDTSEAHNIPIVVKVGLKKDKNPSYGDKNAVKGYIKVGEEHKHADAPAKPTGNGQRPPWAAGR